MHRRRVPTGARPAGGPDERGPLPTLPDIERALHLIVAGFNLLYTASLAPNLIEMQRSTSVVGGVLIPVLIAVPLILIAAIATRRRVPRAAWVASAAALAATVPVWALTTREVLGVGLRQGEQLPPLLFTVTPVAVLVCLMAVRSIVLVALASATMLAAATLVATTAAAIPAVRAVEAAVLMIPLGVTVAAVVTTVRRAAARAAREQRAMLLELSSARLSDATETERVRTDALVHDVVLTTLLQASSADADDTEGVARAREMAYNALRVIGHVSRSGEMGAGVRLGTAVSQHAQRLAPLLQHFDVVIDDAHVEDLLLPADVADALLAALAEAMQNSVRYAGLSDRTVRILPLGADGLRIEVEDDGAGFHYPGVRGDGLRQRIVAPLLAVEGRADIVTSPGGGTCVRLTWGSVAMADVRSISMRLAGAGA